MAWASVQQCLWTGLGERATASRPPELSGGARSWASVSQTLQSQGGNLGAGACTRGFRRPMRTRHAKSDDRRRRRPGRKGSAL